MREKKPAPKTGKTDALREAREKAAAEREARGAKPSAARFPPRPKKTTPAKPEKEEP